MALSYALAAIVVRGVEPRGVGARTSARPTSPPSLNPFAHALALARVAETFGLRWHPSSGWDMRRAARPGAGVSGPRPEENGLATPAAAAGSTGRVAA